MQPSQAPRTGQRISAMPPRGKTPGLKVGRNNLRYWVAGNVQRDPMGFPDRTIPLPVDANDAEIAALCQEHTARLRDWCEEQKKAEKADPPATKTRYDGSVRSACRVYQEHPLSPFNTNVKHNTRATYVTSLKLIEATVGTRLIRNLTVLDVKNWYNQWRKPAQPDGVERVDRAHDGVSMFRTVMWFMTALRTPECKQLAEELKAVRFEKGGARVEAISHAQVMAFIRKADEMGRAGIIPAERALYLSIGMAAQFELMLRQMDIIGDWFPLQPAPRLPKGAPTISDGKEIWAGFFTWEMVPGWRWRMKTSKSKYRAGQQFNLANHDVLFPLLEAVPHDQRVGSIVKGERGLPVRQTSYTRWFRLIATAAGIPKEVWNMDARAGGATEADNAGAPLALIQKGLTHTQAATTGRYLRGGSSAATDELADVRRRGRAGDKSDGGTP